MEKTFSTFAWIGLHHALVVHSSTSSIPLVIFMYRQGAFCLAIYYFSLPLLSLLKFSLDLLGETHFPSFKKIVSVCKREMSFVTFYILSAGYSEYNTLHSRCVRPTSQH